MAEEFQFPDEIEEQGKKPQSFAESDIEIEVVDDRPEEDQKNASPLPKEIVEDIENDSLEEYSKEAKQRLLQMKKLINDERREKEQALREQQEAIRVAQQVLQENQHLKGSLSSGERVLVDNVRHSAAQELETAKKAYKDAYDSGDSDLLVDAQDKLTEAKIKMKQFENYRYQYDADSFQNQQNAVQSQLQQSQPARLDSKTQAWLDKNSWYGTDDDMSFLAMGIHRRLERDGVPIGSDHYWQSIDSEMHKRFPEKFAGESAAETKDSGRSKSSTVVAPATRSTSPKRVRLTQTQLALAKKFKLSPEQYAMELTKLESQNG